MRNQSVFYNYPLQVDHVLEIRLCAETWNKIKLIAAMRNRSYSWVVRYATFRTIKRKDIQSFFQGNGSEKLARKFSELDEAAKKRKNSNSVKHRHKLCLYGEDELYIRVTAAQMGCTMTHLIRVALEYRLVEMLMKTSFLSRIGRFGRFSRASWYWMGIKVYCVREFPNSSISSRYFEFKAYEKDEYW